MMLICTPICHQRCQISFQNVCWLHFVHFISTTIYHPGLGLFIFSCRSWQDSPNWSHWLLSFSAESYPARHYQISFPKTLLSWCNCLPRDLKIVRLKKTTWHHLSQSLFSASTFQQIALDRWSLISNWSYSFPMSDFANGFHLSAKS